MKTIESKVQIPHQWLHMGEEQLKKEHFNEIKNLVLSNKPSGGLWASPYERRGRYLSDWHEKSMDMGFEEAKHAVLFSLKEDASVCIIDNQLDLMNVACNYPANESTPMASMFFMSEKYINFEALKKDYDVIYLTEKGQWATRMPQTNQDYNLYGWDCASCIVLNFDVIDHQETIIVY